MSEVDSFGVYVFLVKSNILSSTEWCKCNHPIFVHCNYGKMVNTFGSACGLCLFAFRQVEQLISVK